MSTIDEAVSSGSAPDARPPGARPGKPPDASPPADPASAAPPPAALRAVALELLRTDDAWLSHGSALFVHGWAEAPRELWTASGPRLRRPRAVPGGQLRIVVCAGSARFGLEDREAGPALPIRLTDPERTLVDGLRRPGLCGGLAAVAALIVGPGTLADARGPAPRPLDAGRLADYALRLGVGAVVRRLGFLLELRRPVHADAVARLRAALSPTWTSLDPARPRGGLHLERWRLVVNVPPEDIAAAAGLGPDLWAAAARPTHRPGGVAATARGTGADVRAGTRADAAAGPAGPGRPGGPGGSGGSGEQRGPSRAAEQRSPGRSPKALASLCCRHDVWRVAVLDGALADLAGREGREAWLAGGGPGPAGHSGAGGVPGEKTDRACAADGEAAPERVALLVDFHYKRETGLRELAALEAELSAALGRPVALRTMDDLVRRLARAVWRQAGLIYFRKDGGHRSSARAQALARRRRELPVNET